MNGVDGLLRAEGRFSASESRVPWLSLALLLVIGGFLYGAVMGGYGFRVLQSLYSGLKVPLLLTISTFVCLPNFYVVNSVLDLRDDFLAACRGILAAQATMGVTLAALAPVTVVFYATTTNYNTLLVVNGAMFAMATYAGQLTLRRHYAYLIARDPRHRLGRLAWVVVYTFVAIQLAWVLRPFIGAPSMPSQFLRDDPWSNAYVQVSRTLWQTLQRWF